MLPGIDRLSLAKDAREFQTLLESELEQMNAEVELEYAEISEALISDQISAHELDILGERIVQLDACIRKFFHGLLDCVRKFDRETSWFVARLQKEKFATVDLEKLLMTLGLVWTRLRRVQSGKEAGKEAWVPPETFVRETAKYWVRPEMLVRLKTEIVRNLPYLVFGKTAEEQEKELLRGESLMRELSETSRPQLITSVYFDSERGHSYEERLLRKEGARLLRVRWYGRNEGNVDKELYVERKIHHESWTKTPSSKDRFVLNQGSVGGFLTGKYIPENNALANEVHDMIQTHKLRPMVRTCYFRSAFQAQDSNAVRISLDTNLTLINELTAGISGVKNFWCRSADDVLSAADIVKFPYAILEIKLQDGSNPPVWVSDLLRKSQAVRVHKFSKFLHGMAFIHRNRVQQLPHWMPLKTPVSAGEEDGDNQSEKLLDMKSIEPKSLFANERTFLHYMLKGVYLLLLDASAVSVLIVALYTTWCLWQYFSRARKILAKRAVEGGAERLDVSHGPAVVLVVVSFSLFSVLWYRLHPTSSLASVHSSCFVGN